MTPPTLLGRSAAFAAVVSVLAGCAVQAPQVAKSEPPIPAPLERAAQAAATAPTTPVLKRKIALGRVTNETQYGQSLLRDRSGDPLGKQVGDLLGKALTESGAYLVFERPDISRLQAESRVSGEQLNLVGVDTLIMGSLTEFGRKTVGQTGFVSASKRQVAFAKVDLRLVDARTGHVFHAVSGAGEASTETASTFGFGSQASYDATLNDAAIRQAVGDVVSKLAQQMNQRPWQTGILSVEGTKVFIAGGKAQGIQPGMVFSVQTPGRRVKSPQTGMEITLPGSEVAQLRVDSNFGQSETDEGSIASLLQGNLTGTNPQDLIVRNR